MIPLWLADRQLGVRGLELDAQTSGPSLTVLAGQITGLSEPPQSERQCVSPVTDPRAQVLAVQLVRNGWAWIVAAVDEVELDRAQTIKLRRDDSLYEGADKSGRARPTRGSSGEEWA